MEIGRLVRHPGDETRDLVNFNPLLLRTMHAGQLRVADMGVDRAVADQMHGNRITPALCFGDSMIHLQTLAQRSVAQPAFPPCRKVRHKDFKHILTIPSHGEV